MPLTLYSPSNWASRIAAVFPRRWASRAFQSNPPNPVLVPLTNSIGVGLSDVMAALVYVQLQTRLATMTDTNCEDAAADFFGIDGFPRATGEGDSSYSMRIRLALFNDGTIAGITRIVQAFLTTFTNPNPTANIMGIDSQGGMDTGASLDEPVPLAQVAPTRLLAVDTQGGFDTSGVFDRALAQGLFPNVVVFDQTSNPAFAAAVTPTPITPPQFGIYFQYPGYSDALQIVAPYSPILARMVNLYRGMTTVPVFIANYPVTS